MMILRMAGAFLLSALCISAPLTSYAQYSYVNNRPLNVVLTPEHPDPGETVRLTVSSYALDLNRSVITWSANGTVFARGAGRTEASIAAGGVGSATEILVEAVAENGESGSAQARIALAEIELLWTTDSYVPPFYKGRKLAGTSATIHTYAATRFVSGTTRIPEADIIYTWSRNGSVIATASGRGKSRATLQGPLLGTDTLRVVAESIDGRHRAETSIQVVAHDSPLIVYENHPLFGVLYHRAIIGDVNTIERELRVSAVPYFARSDTSRTLVYDWRVNGGVITPDPAAPDTLTINATSYSGPADIALTVMNPADMLMRSVGAWRIIFGNDAGLFSSGTSLFGE